MYYHQDPNKQKHINLTGNWDTVYLKLINFVATIIKVLTTRMLMRKPVFSPGSFCLSNPYFVSIRSSTCSLLSCDWVVSSLDLQKNAKYDQSHSCYGNSMYCMVIILYSTVAYYISCTVLLFSETNWRARERG